MLDGINLPGAVDADFTADRVQESTDTKLFISVLPGPTQRDRPKAVATHGGNSITLPLVSHSPCVDRNSSGDALVVDSHARNDRNLKTMMTCEQVKEKAQNAQAPEKPPYNVHHFYHAEGFFQRLAKDPVFENLTLGVIALNAIWIAIDTDYNKADSLLDAHPIFVLFDTLFFLYFSIELVIRFLAFKYKYSCLRDAWFVFDTMLVALYLFDPFIIAVMAAASGGSALDLPTSILRLFRLARLSRLVRLLRSQPELLMLVKGMLTATASVSYSLGLLLMLTYIFAIALANLSSDHEFGEEFFSSVPMSMYSLIIFATFLDDLSYFCDAIKEESTLCLMLVAVFVVLASMTVMNVLIGVLCEVVEKVADRERESLRRENLQGKFTTIAEELDKNDNGQLSWKEFEKIMDLPAAVEALESVNIDPLTFIDAAEEMFIDAFTGTQKELTLDQFMDMVLGFCGEQDATVRDVMSLGKRLNKNFSDLKSRSRSIDKKLGKLLRITQRDSRFDGQS